MKCRILYILCWLFMIISMFNAGNASAANFRIRANEDFDTTRINNKINVLNAHVRYWFSGQYTAYNYTFKQITPKEYQAQKPATNLSFDAGFVDPDGTIVISIPETPEQKAVFTNLTQVALYYLCQSYMFHFYETANLPLLFKVGFSIFEGGLLPSDDTIKVVLDAYGGALSSFDDLNNVKSFIDKKGYAIAGAFCEFMNVYKNWGYQYINNLTQTGFGTDSWWFNTTSKEELLADFNRYLYARYLQPDENNRLKICYESNSFKFYTTPRAAAINLPYFSQVLDSAYIEYTRLYRVEAGEKLTFTTMIGCEDGDIEGLKCDSNGRLTGGTAWSSGLHTTSSPSSELLFAFRHQNRHELGHTFQGLMHQGVVTAWLNEGFADFCALGPVSAENLKDVRQKGMDALVRATTYFGHRPTYEETRIYPSPDYGYYTLGYIFNDYIFKRGGYDLVKKVQQNDRTAYQSLGYTSAQSFLNDFYLYFDAVIQGKTLVELASPTAGLSLIDSLVELRWTPLDSTSKYTVSVSTDQKNTWSTLAGRTTNTSFTWNARDFKGVFYLKFSTPDNLNLESVYGPFRLIDLNKVELLHPAGNNFLIAGDTAEIRWSQTNIPQLKIEFSDDNGKNWTTVNASVASASRAYSWVVPDKISACCQLRISDAHNAGTSAVNEGVFSILMPDKSGGPYLYDKNTIALLHFDNDLNNRSTYSGNPGGLNSVICMNEQVLPGMGNCYKTTTPLFIPHSGNLNLSGDWTIEAWIKLNSYNPDNDIYIVQKPGDSNSYLCNYALSINPWWGNVLYGFYFSDPDTRIGSTAQTIQLNEWYHVAMIRNTQDKMLRIVIHDRSRNQVFSAENPYTPTTTLLNSQNLLIGSNMNGYIDEVRISNVARDLTTSLASPKVQQSSVEVFTNPSGGMIKIVLQPEALYSTLSITTISGQLVYCNPITSTGEVQLDLSALKKGVYLLTVGQNRIHPRSVSKFILN